MKVKFFEKIVLSEWKEFQDWDTEEKKRYITLYGHRHFSKWLAGMIIDPWSFFIVTGIALCLSILNIVMFFVVDERAVYMGVFYKTFPFVTALIFLEYYIVKVSKMEEKQFKEWFQKATEKIQNLLFKDFKIFSIRKRLYVRRIDKQFYNYLLTDKCRRECYRCSFKLAQLLNDPKVKILWIAATEIGLVDRYGHAVIERNGLILDTNTRRCYNKTKYLKAHKAEIFKEYVLEEYKKVKTPWELKWDEFGDWCEVHNVQRCS